MRSGLSWYGSVSLFPSFFFSPSITSLPLPRFSNLPSSPNSLAALHRIFPSHSEGVLLPFYQSTSCHMLFVAARVIAVRDKHCEMETCHMSSTVAKRALGCNIFRRKNSTGFQQSTTAELLQDFLCKVFLQLANYTMLCHFISVHYGRQDSLTSVCISYNRFSHINEHFFFSNSDVSFSPSNENWTVLSALFLCNTALSISCQTRCSFSRTKTRDKRCNSRRDKRCNSIQGLIPLGRFGNGLIKS